MNLAIITPTRQRWPWLLQQAKRLAPQLKPDDRWIIVIDQDALPPQVFTKLSELIGPERLTWVSLSYYRQEPPVARISYAHNAGAALAPCGYALVEVDDHDLIEPDALQAVRDALDRGIDYVFGWYRQQAILVAPGGKLLAEMWPNVERTYEPGGFHREELGTDGLALRAIRRTLWDRLGGWSLDVWPRADKDFALRAEADGAKIECLQRFLCTVTIDGDSMSATYRGVNPADCEPAAEADCEPDQELDCAKNAVAEASP